MKIMTLEALLIVTDVVNEKVNKYRINIVQESLYINA